MLTRATALMLHGGGFDKERFLAILSYALKIRVAKGVFSVKPLVFVGFV